MTWMFCFVRYFVTGNAKHLIFRRHCDPLAKRRSNPKLYRAKGKV